MRNEFLVFGMPPIEDPEIQEVVASLRAAWLGTGPKVAKFETAFAAYKGMQHAIALNSCTAALHLAIVAAGIGPGDEVITTPLTFCATANAIIHSGATPVLADVDPVTMNLDPDCVNAAVTSRTKAILPVHFAGRPCDMDRLCAIAERNGLLIIEDCAHAIETEFRGRRAGTIGDFGCFSFYVTKNIVTGEGGMVLTRDEAAAARIRILGLHGMSKDAWKRFGNEGYKHYEVVECGFKYNMTDLQAAIGIHQLDRVDSYWRARAKIWDRYNLEFADLPLQIPAPPSADTRHAFHLYTVLVDQEEAGLSRDAFLDAMTRQNIGVGVHYLALPEHEYYRNRFGWRPELVPNATRIGRQTVSLPISARLSHEDVTDVIEAVRSALASPATQRSSGTTQ